MAEQSKPQAAVERIDMLKLTTEQEVLSALMSGKCDLEQASNRLAALKAEAIRIAKQGRIASVKLEGGETDGELVIRIPLHTPREAEKTYVVGSTGGQLRTNITLQTPAGPRQVRVTAMAMCYRQEK